MMTKPGVLFTLLLLSVLCINLYAIEERLVATDGDIQHRFGTSVAIDSSTLCVGTPGSLNDADFRGAVYIYEYNTTKQSWVERQKLTIEESSYDLFGSSVAKSDSFLIVGARGDSLNNPFGGAAFIYKQQPDKSWIFFQKLVTNQFIPLDGFGFAVDIDGACAVVSAPRTGGAMPLSGAVYVYHLVDDEWILDVKLVAAPSAMNDNFGVSVALSNQELVVGATALESNSRVPRQSSPGAAFIFKRDENGWLQTAYLSPDDANFGNMFGRAVSIDGDYVVVGAPKDDVLDFDDGSVYIYKRSETGWRQEVKLVALDADSGDAFGAALDVNQDYMVVGAPGVNGWGQNTGAVYSFLHGDEGWIQRSKKMAYDAAPFDKFGTSVAVDKNMSVIGAPHKKVSARTSQGAAYVYDNIADLALPVELTCFTATLSDAGVLLQWMTQSEKDNLGFMLQRREADETWEIVASFQTHDALRGQGSKSMPTSYEYLDDSAEMKTYSYRLADVDYNGVVRYHDPIQVAVSSGLAVGANKDQLDFKLSPAFPNPFNPQTIINFDVARLAHVTIRVVDVSGRHVRTLLNENRSAGTYSISWDGRNDVGGQMSSGVYFIQAQAHDWMQIQKVMLLQ